MIKSQQKTNRPIKLTKDEKNALKVAGATTALSVVQTAGNYVKAQGMLNAMGYGDKILISQVIKKGAVAAGRSAVIGILAYAGGKTVHNYVKNRKNDN